MQITNKGRVKKEIKKQVNGRINRADFPRMSNGALGLLQDCHNVESLTINQLNINR
jgi:hypothetical protein